MDNKEKDSFDILAAQFEEEEYFNRLKLVMEEYQKLLFPFVKGKTNANLSNASGGVVIYNSNLVSSSNPILFPIGGNKNGGGNKRGSPKGRRNGNQND